MVALKRTVAEIEVEVAALKRTLAEKEDEVQVIRYCIDTNDVRKYYTVIHRTNSTYYHWTVSLLSFGQISLTDKLIVTLYSIGLWTFFPQPRPVGFDGTGKLKRRSGPSDRPRRSQEPIERLPALEWEPRPGAIHIVVICWCTLPDPTASA